MLSNYAPDNEVQVLYAIGKAHYSRMIFDGIILLFKQVNTVQC